MEGRGGGGAKLLLIDTYRNKGECLSITIKIRSFFLIAHTQTNDFLKKIQKGMEGFPRIKNACWSMQSGRF